MTKTRTLQLLALAASAVATAIIAGCVSNETTMDAALAPEPGDNLVFADTTQPVRDYPQSVATIANGDTQADGTTGFRYRSADNIRYGLTPVVEPGVFAANVVTAPYTLIAERNDEHVSTGLQFPPTHTAMPALPPENVPVAPEAPPAEEPTDPMAPDALSPTTMPAAAEAAADNPADILVRNLSTPDGPSFGITGQVMRPGMYQLKDVTLSQVISAASPSTEDPTKVRVQIDRPGEESAVTTLDQLLTGKVEDIKVKAGDVITISVLP